MLMMTIRRGGMGEGTARRYKGQRHIHADDAECEKTGEGFGGLSVHRLRVLTCCINYAVLHQLSTDGCSRVLQNVAHAAIRREAHDMVDRLRLLR